MQVKIRSARARDSERILELLIELGRPKPQDKNDYRKFKRLIEYYIISKEEVHSILVATDDSKIIGLVSYELLDRLNQHSREFWIPELIVSEKYRDQGIGRTLIQNCESIARKKKCFRIRLESANYRIESHRFYEKMGFSQTALTFEKELRN